MDPYWVEVRLEDTDSRPLSYSFSVSMMQGVEWEGGRRGTEHTY